MTQAQDIDHEPFGLYLAAGGSIVAGPVRSPRNIEQSLPNSIHNDAVAQKLGMRGGTVAGSLHMEQFPPLLVAEFGSQWWPNGGLSLYFRYATTDREPVQCLVASGESRQNRGAETGLDGNGGSTSRRRRHSLGGSDSCAHAVGGAGCQCTAVE